MQIFLVSLPDIHAEIPFDIFESIDRRNNRNAVTAHAQFKAVHIYLKIMQNIQSQPKLLCFCFVNKLSYLLCLKS